MKDTLENQFNMILAVLLLLDNNNTIWSANIPFKNAKNTLDALVPVIRALILLQEIDNKGISTAKENKAKLLVDTVIPISKAIIAYANSVNNPELKQKVDYSKSDLINSRDNIIVERANIIIAAANENLLALTPYGITAGSISAATTISENFEDAIPTTRIAIVEHKTATQNLTIKIKEAMDILRNQLDNLIYAYETTHPDFFKDYKSARIIVNN
jgi:hypothetical protein